MNTLTADSELTPARSVNALIEQNTGLVVHLAKSICSANGSLNELEDYISVGMLGLIQAASHYDGMREVRFSTYAAKCIKNEMFQYLHRQCNWNRSCKIGQVMEELLGDWLSHTETKMLMEELCASLNEEEREVTELRYGLRGKQPLTQQEVALRLSRSQSFVCKVEKRALKKLKRAMDVE